MKTGKDVLQASKANHKYVVCIEQGPLPVRIVAVGGSFLSCVNAGLTMLNPLGLLTNSVNYVLSSYQMMFCLTTSLFEAKVEWVQSLRWLDQFQTLLVEKAKFLSELPGRGAVHIFQGSLWLCFASSTEIFALICGVYMVFLGFLDFAMHFGGFATIAEKAGYSSLAVKESLP